MSPFRGVFFLLNLLSAILVASALRNVTVDDTDASIAYAGSWEASSTLVSTLDYGGSHTLSDNAAAIATFTFTGVAVYYLAPKWPYAVDTRIALDGQTPTTVNLTDTRRSPNIDGHETLQSAVVWSVTGLANGPHKVEVTRGTLYAVVDGFIYTVQENTETTAVTTETTAVTTTVTATSFSPPPTDSDVQGVTTTSSSSSAPPPTSSTSSKKSLSLGVILGISIPSGLLVAALLALIILFAKRRSDKRTENPGYPGTYTIPSSGPTTTNTTSPFFNGASRPTSTYAAGVGASQTFGSGRTGGPMGTSSPPLSMYGQPEMGQYPNPNPNYNQPFANVYGLQANNQPQPLQSFTSLPPVGMNVQPQAGLTYYHPFSSGTLPQTNVDTSPGRGASNLPYDILAGAAGAVRDPSYAADRSPNTATADVSSYAQPPQSFAYEAHGSEQAGSIPPPYLEYGNSQGQSSAPVPTSSSSSPLLNPESDSGPRPEKKEATYSGGQGGSSWRPPY